MTSRKALIIGLALAVGASIPATAQDGWQRDPDRDRQAQDYGWRDRDGDRDRDYGRDRFEYAARTARQFGFQDGLNNGSRDRYTGHSYRPTHDRDYKHADRGYDDSFGRKDEYKELYRQAYLSGYQQGYNHSGDRDGDYDHDRR